MIWLLLPLLTQRKWLDSTAALSWKINAITANAASQTLVETVDAAAFEVDMVVVPE